MCLGVDRSGPPVVRRGADRVRDDRSLFGSVRAGAARDELVARVVVTGDPLVNAGVHRPVSAGGVGTCAVPPWCR